MPSIWALLLGPRLYGFFGRPNHQESTFENFGNTVISFSSGIYYITSSLAFGPIILCYLYSRDWLTPVGMMSLLKYATYLVIVGYGARAFGRIFDETTSKFLDIWQNDQLKKDDNNHAILKGYDFELINVSPDFEARPNPHLWYLKPELPEAGLLTRGIASWAIHAFGRHLIYPGSMGLLKYMMRPNLNSARKLLVQNKSGQRIWIKTSEGDVLDAMYLIGTSPRLSQNLVICFEGNAGFYEIGVMNSPAQLGYTTLGFNLPGFGESTGLPYAKNTLAAADAVMQYSIEVLGYRQENIVLFGWSIGGFPVACDYTSNANKRNEQNLISPIAERRRYKNPGIRRQSCKDTRNAMIPTGGHIPTAERLPNQIPHQSPPAQQNRYHYVKGAPPKLVKAPSAHHLPKLQPTPSRQSLSFEQPTQGYSKQPSAALQQVSGINAHAKPSKEKDCPTIFGVDNTDKKRKEVITNWVHQVLIKGVDGLKKEYQDFPNVGTINEAKVFFNNPTRNRYIDIPCCDATRIKLPDDPNFYIHANMVSSSQNRRYICAQAPLNSTVEEFWKMIVYSDVEFIIMLCEFVENNKPKSAEYFPPKVGQSMKIGKFCYVTNVISEKIDKTLTMTTLLVTKQCNEDSSHIVSHIHWHNWPDHGVPDNFISPLLLLNAFKRCTKPITVHCSAGVGRTGTLVLILIVLESLRLPCFSGVPPLFAKLREERFKSIQTELQYLYVHRCVLEYVLRKKYRFDREAYAKFVRDFKMAELTCCNGAAAN